jgi:hypothetical protein
MSRINQLDNLSQVLAAGEDRVIDGPNAELFG